VKVIDPGHKYALRHLDGAGETLLNFVKRVGPKYPGNTGHHEGTNIQEVARVLIDRLQYLESQDHDPRGRNTLAIYNLREVIRLMEDRAAERHGRDRTQLAYQNQLESNIEEMPVCPICGHIGCDETAARRDRAVARGLERK
jgi:hypothetical protein